MKSKKIHTIAVTSGAEMLCLGLDDPVLIAKITEMILLGRRSDSTYEVRKVEYLTND